MICHNILPRCQIKTTARTDFTGKYDWPLSEKTKKSFGNLLMTNRTFGKECWRGPLFNLCHPSSKSGRFIWRSGNYYSTNQTQRDTPLFEELSGAVTITDPTHPLYGQTFPLLTVRVNRSKTHVTVLLSTGRRRSVPRLATNLECPAEESSSDPPLPVISVRTILPLAHLVQGLKQAKEESHAEQAASTIQPTEQCSTSSYDPSSIGFLRAANSNSLTWSPNSFSASG